MYPVKLGFSEAKKRINNLLKNGHHAEALLTSVFTFEKIIHRTLKQLVISAGFRSKDAASLLRQLQGFSKQKEIWACFDPNNRSLPEVIGNKHWQHVKRAVSMRNDFVHGARVYDLSECETMTRNILELLDQTVKCFNDTYRYDGWKIVNVRFKSRLHVDPKVRIDA